MGTTSNPSDSFDAGNDAGSPGQLMTLLKEELLPYCHYVLIRSTQVG